MITFDELQKMYNSENIVQVEDLEHIRSMAVSRCSDTWGCGPISRTGWRTLAHPSRRTRDDVRTLFVCTEDDYKKAIGAV